MPKPHENFGDIFVFWTSQGLLILPLCLYLPTIRKSSSTWYLSHSWTWKRSVIQLFLSTHRCLLVPDQLLTVESSSEEIAVQVAGLCPDQEPWCDAHLHPTRLQWKLGIILSTNFCGRIIQSLMCCKTSILLEFMTFNIQSEMVVSGADFWYGFKDSPYY